MKNVKIIFLFSLCVLYSCANNNFKNVKEVLELEIDTISNITQKRLAFLNITTNKEVSILHHLEQTGFHFYNSLKFKTAELGVLVGGTGLRVRITEDGGRTWTQFCFSRFANVFHSVSFSGKSLFIVGASKYIFKSSDFGKNWSVFDTGQKGMVYPKYYKIHFLNNRIGFISGGQEDKPVLLKTINGGKDWEIIETKGFINKESAISDFKILSEKEIIIVTKSGRCYKSIDQGSNWKLLYSCENKYEALNSIDFKDLNVGCIGGINGKLLYTNDGGESWRKIKIPEESTESNVSEILFVKNQILITTSKSFNEIERKAFVYSISEEGNNIQPFLTKIDNEVFFVGDSYGLDILEDNIYILDRNNLYKTSIIERK